MLRRWLDTPIISWEYDWMPRGEFTPENMPQNAPKGKEKVFQASIFRCKTTRWRIVSGRVIEWSLVDSHHSSASAFATVSRLHRWQVEVWYYDDLMAKWHRTSCKRCLGWKNSAWKIWITQCGWEDLEINQIWNWTAQNQKTWYKTWWI